MIIYQLHIVNFKSYNGQHTLGPFDPHFNCVIGPNGNGKSNIIDAVLFVFGFKSSKLRQDSLASLIHRSAFAQPQKASVSVLFQENGQYVSVSRSVTRSGNTYYKLNDEKIGWNDLRQMLLRKKIDLNKNLFIILQGEVQRLCELSPDTMVEYLQYVSGSDELKEPIQAAQRIYIQLSVKRQEAKMNLNVKKKIFDSLDERVREITIKILIRLRVYMLHHLVIKKSIIDNELTLAKLKEQEKAKNKAIQDIEAEIQQIQLKIQAKIKELAPIECKMAAQEKEISALERRSEKTIMMTKQVQREITFLSKDRQKKNQEKARYSQQQNQLRQMVQHQKQFIQRLKQIKKQIGSEKHLPKLKSCLQLQTKLTSLKEEQQVLINKNNEENTNLSISRQKLQIFDQKSKENKQLKQTLKNKIKGCIIEKKEVQGKLAQTTDLIEQLQRQVKVKSTDKLYTTSNQEKIINQIRSANKAKILCPETTLVTLRDLVAITPAYRQVIETILPQLDYFVVDTFNQAKTISEYLKKKQIGRMSFLIKDLINQSAKEIKVPSGSPANTKLVIDLIKYTNSDARNILVWAVGNTVIANDLETAVRVAYYDQKKYRAITPKGEFIDSSGTMTKLALKSVAKGEDHQFLHEKIQTLKRVRSNLQDKKLRLQKQLGEIGQQQQKIVTEQRGFDGLDEVILDELQKQVLKDRKQISANHIKLKEITDDLQKLKDELYQAKFDMNLYQQRLSILRQIAQNEQKIKKVQNCDNIILSLEQKRIKSVQQIEEITLRMEERMKAKVACETQQAKIRKQVEERQSLIHSVVASKVAVQAQIASLEEQKGFRQSKLGQHNRNNANDKLRAELNRLRAYIRTVDFEQMELRSKLQRSLDSLKDYCWSIYKNIYNKYPELVPLQQKPSLFGVQSNTLTYLLQSQAPLQISKQEISFLAALTTEEREYLLSASKKKITFYKHIESFFPNSSIEGLMFEAIETKDIKLSYTYEIEKLKHQEREGVQDEDSYQINLQLFRQYKEVKDEFEGLDKRMKEIQFQVNAKKNELIELRNKRLTIFMDNFNQINIQLNRIYNILTGGKAQLNFLDSINPFEGVQFSVRPVNKSWKRVNLLSGGQKTFTSLALIFACEQIKSFPFYFMDEIDAALDYKNTTLLAHFIKQKTNTQHIVISLRKNMYQECNRLIGIYKVKDQSRTIEVTMEELKTNYQ